MSDTEYDRIPPLTLGLRLKMAMSWAGYHREDMAAELGVDASTVSRWMNDKGEPPKRGNISTWARFTHCNFQVVAHRRAAT
jgi:transcriptional regulator with XRE-family HTH domain